MVKTCFCDSSASLKPAWLVLKLRRKFLGGTFPRVRFTCRENAPWSVCMCVCVCELLGGGVELFSVL